MRVRSKIVSPTFQSGKEGNFSPLTGSWIGTPANVSVQLTFDVSSMRDYPTKQFKKLSGQGRLINTQMIQDRDASTVIPSSDFRVWNSGNLSQAGYRRENQFGADALGYGSRVQDENYVATEAERLRTLAITECFASVAEPDIESLVSAAELKETLEFLRSPLEKAVKLTKRWSSWSKMKKADLERYQKNLDRWSSRGQKGPAPTLRERGKFSVGKWSGHDIPSGWLAYRYGLMPLIYDVQGVMKAFDRKLGKTVRQTYRATREAHGNIVFDVTAGPYAFKDRYVYSTTVFWSCTVRAGCVAEYVVTRAQTIGLHWSYLPSAAWEATTLSFVADWFMNFGDYLKAISVSARADIKIAWTVTNTEFQRTTTVSGYCEAPYVMSYDKEPVSVTVKSRKSRDPNPGASVGVTRQWAMNTKRYVDAAALISTLLKRK